MKSSILSPMPILACAGILIHLTSAQHLAYSSYTVTECVTATDLLPDKAVFPPAAGPTIATAPCDDHDHAHGDGRPPLITLSYSMPPCAEGDCPSCTLLSSFTTAYPAFPTPGVQGPIQGHAQGEMGMAMATQSYVITETYIGLSSLPPFAKPTAIPYGFVTGIETCDPGVCGGAESITATVTYPASNNPVPAHTPENYASGAGAPTPAHDEHGCDVAEGASGEKCSTFATHTGGSLDNPTGTAPASAQQPTAVVAGGNILRGPFEVVFVFVLLIAAP
ncbi:hypothetical protein F4808DRAFT_107929 [Astrocystis sublimbata]|nr:hypothetical protein F4808DRAFT_107929 [Astrocystis sublimbata]